MVRASELCLMTWCKWLSTSWEAPVNGWFGR